MVSFVFVSFSVSNGRSAIARNNLFRISLKTKIKEWKKRSTLNRWQIKWYTSHTAEINSELFRRWGETEAFFVEKKESRSEKKMKWIIVKQ